MQELEIPVDKLPSKGKLYPFNYITLPRLKFSTVLDYQSDLSCCRNELSKFVTQLKYLLRDLPSYKQLLMYDAVPLLLIRTYASATPELSNHIRIKFICPIHRQPEEFDINLESIEFNDIDPELYKIDTFRINNQTFKFRLPTVDDFLRTADTFMTILPVKDSVAMKMIWILSMFSEVDKRENRSRILQAVRTATSEGNGIKTLTYLYSKLTNAFTHLTTECRNGGETVKVEIPVIEPLTAYFLNFSIQGKPDGDIFTYKTEI